MKNIIIGLSIFVASVNATDYCWAEEAGYPWYEFKFIFFFILF